MVFWWLCWHRTILMKNIRQKQYSQFPTVHAGFLEIKMRRGLCTMCDQSPSDLCLGDSVARDRHVVIGWTLARLAGAVQSCLCSLSHINDVTRDFSAAPLLSHTSVNEQGQHSFGQWLVACSSAPSHYLKHLPIGPLGTVLGEIRLKNFNWRKWFENSAAKCPSFCLGDNGSSQSLCRHRDSKPPPPHSITVTS